jgi:hypothetical protein
MRLISFTSYIVACFLVGTGVALGQTKEERPSKPENAALKYWQAFGLLPRLDAEREKILAERDTVLFDDATKKLLEDTKSAIMLMRRGAAVRNCDWGLDLVQDGPQTLMPHLNKARELANHALLHARWHFEHRKFSEGLDTTAAVFTLARHLGTDATLISLLVQRSIETQTIHMLARYLPEFDAEMHQRLAAMLEGLPPGGSIRTAILMERDSGAGWTLRQLRTENLGVGAAIQDIVQAAGGPKGPTKQLEELISQYEEFARIASLPREEFEPRWTAQTKKLEGNVFARLLMPAVDKVYDAEERAKTHWAMFNAARAVVQNGPGKLKDFPDLVGNEPFGYVAHSGGFELKSKVIYKGQALKLRIGKPN